MAAKAKLDEGKYEQAMQEFSDLKSYRDSPDLYREARFRWGKALMDRRSIQRFSGAVLSRYRVFWCEG